MEIVEKLKSLNSSEFFKKAEVTKDNYGENIIISDGVYTIKINESKKIANIGLHENPMFPIAPDENLFLKNVYLLAEHQEDLIEGINYKEFKKIYVKGVFGKKPNFFNLRRISNSKVDELIESSKEYMKENNAKWEKWEKDKSEFYELYKTNAIFLLSIVNEMKELKKEYTIKTTLSSKFYKDMVEVLNKSGILL